MKVYLDNRQDIKVDQEIIDLMEKGIGLALVEEGKGLDWEISISLVENEEIRDLNRDFRKVDRETDVLSFPIDEDFLIPGGPNLLGDIIISVSKAREQALEYGHSFKREMVYLTIHSAFHLLGYDHMTEEDKKLMRGKEENVLRKLEI